MRLGNKQLRVVLCSQIETQPKKINLDMSKREPGRKGGWTRKNWGVEVSLEGEVGRVDNSLITGCVSADRVCSRSREVNRVIDWDYYCTHQCCAESSKIWNVELTSPGPVPINLGSCMHASDHQLEAGVMVHGGTWSEPQLTWKRRNG